MVKERSALVSVGSRLLDEISDGVGAGHVNCMAAGIAWLPAASVVTASARPAMARCAAGGIILSSVATGYQLGFTLQTRTASARQS
jgi:hypothetical protein